MGYHFFLPMVFVFRARAELRYYLCLAVKFHIMIKADKSTLPNKVNSSSEAMIFAVANAIFTIA